ncbi:MAG: hypothetical protein Q4B40_04855 [Clostridia bacterium]|nr:hypothetical protein [Clostridia bacterium]
MKKTNFKKLLSLIVCVVLVAAMALTSIGCKDNATTGEMSSGITATQAKAEFDFTVVHKDGSEKSIKITTDKSTVGEALQAEGIITGDQSEYGLFVKTVDGETLDYDADGYWWAFYIGDEQAMTGVAKTPIEKGKIYSFKAEKA